MDPPKILYEKRVSDFRELPTFALIIFIHFTMTIYIVSIMNTIVQHFQTVIITSMIAKQEVSVQCLDGEVAKGFLHPLIDPEGFSVGEHHASWETITFSCTLNKYRVIL